MENEHKLVGGALVTLALATAAMIVVPFLQLKDEPPPPGLARYTAQELRGRDVYIANGCIACHTQQPGASGASRVDAQRGWGRAAVPGDYFYDRPVLLGTMRTGPDLFNVGARIPSSDWHYGHLFQPRAYVPASIMPAYPYLFRQVDTVELLPSDRPIRLPAGAAPPGKSVVPRPEAEDLVAYLQALRRTYPVTKPVSDPAAAKAAAVARRDAEGPDQ